MKRTSLIIKTASLITIGVSVGVIVGINDPRYNFLSENTAVMGETVESDINVYQAQKSATTGENETNLPITSESKELDLSEDDKYLLSKIIMAEAEDEPFLGQALVGCVVMNRVKSDDFPDTVRDVIFEPGQFTPIENGRFYDVEPDDSCKAAAHLIGTGWDESEGATYFEAVNNASDWHENNLVFLFQKGTHKFYRA